MPSPCNTNVTAHGELDAVQAEELIQRVHNLAQERAKQKSVPIDAALKEIGGELVAEESMMQKIHQRNELLSIQAKRNIKSFVARFPTAGEGLLTFLEGASGTTPGSRNSVDYQSKSLHGKYFGSLVAQIEQAGLMPKFKHGDETFVRDVYREMGAGEPGQPAKSITGNADAFKMAQILDGVSGEMVSRQNRAGAYIRRLPGYITRQTHDQSAIRALGSLGNNKQSKNESFISWRNFVLPLLDSEKTFQGVDPNKFLLNVHEALYSGIHGAERDEANVQGIMLTGSMAKKQSQSRVLHFKDADSAFTYNRALGIKDFKEQVLSDIHSRARSIALMEAMGPNPQATLDQLTRELLEQSRTMDDAAKQVDSLRDWRIRAAFDEIIGKNEVSANPSLSRFIGTAKIILQIAKMGAVTLSSFADKAFLQSEMAFQGISNLETLVKNLTGMAPRKNKEHLRMMGVAMDGLIGNALSRYSNHSTVSGWGHTLQKWFFDLNLLNSWTDANKASAAELMAAHLGGHSHLSFAELPADLSKVLSLYDITSSRWDAVRGLAYEHGDTKSKFITPDTFTKLSDGTIANLVVERGLTPTPANILRERDLLETSFRTYFQDRVDIAVPTPGAAERKYATFGTQAGTPLGEAVRLLTLFKSFPITIMSKVVGRNIYGNGAKGMGDWLLHDHRGKFNLAMLMAMGTAAGYVGGAVKDALRGRTPKPLVSDGQIQLQNLNDAAIRGGSLGILGDVLLSQYDHDNRSFLEYAAGPILGQLNTAFDLKRRAVQGENIAGPAGKLLLDNSPGINLFYIRPVLDYLILWNLQEMMSPGSLRKQESMVERKNRQGYFMRPSETVNK